MAQCISLLSFIPAKVAGSHREKPIATSGRGRQLFRVCGPASHSERNRESTAARDALQRHQFVRQFFFDQSKVFLGADTTGHQKQQRQPRGKLGTIAFGDV